ncbi:MAG: helix-turn-helix domain-containing protein [Firmicutes bacterium]|nr:helix-turn-helix domain-containing protein [Bacillota bacterium]
MQYKLPERLRELRIERGISMQQLSRMLDVADYTANRWERGITIPNTEYLFKLCKFFNCSADFLLGLKDE